MIGSGANPRGPTNLHARVAGLGPHGEFPASIDQLVISDEAAAKARAARYSVAVVLHTTVSGWARQQMAGLRATFDDYGVTIVEVVDCEYRAQKQIEALDALVAHPPDAVISIPVDTALTADAHRRLAAARIRLVLMDNAPLGLLARKDYVTLVSADNFGNGQIAAEILSEHVPPRGTVGIVGFGADFFVTNEREIGFRKWMAERRPDASLRHAQFVDLAAAGDAALELVAGNHPADALFVVWDEPAVHVTQTLRGTARNTPITTIDLGNEVAIEMAGGGMVKGVAAQRPYELGVAEALATVMALAGDQPPPWIALPGLPVTRSNLAAAYRDIWHIDPPPEVRTALDG